MLSLSDSFELGSMFITPNRVVVAVCVRIFIESLRSRSILPISLYRDQTHIEQRGRENREKLVISKEKLERKRDFKSVVKRFRFMNISIKVIHAITG